MWLNCGHAVALRLEILQLRRHHTKLDIGLPVIQLPKSRQFGHDVLDAGPTYGFIVKGQPSQEGSFDGRYQPL